jgi:hypothetical protein
MDVDAGRESVAVKVRVSFGPLAGEHSRSSLVTDSVHWDPPIVRKLRPSWMRSESQTTTK